MCGGWGGYGWERGACVIALPVCGVLGAFALPVPGPARAFPQKRALGSTVLPGRLAAAETT